MKTFHISDVLSVTTGRLVSSRHMEGVYDILNFLTRDSLYTHQLPRAMRECQPWLRVQFPALMDDSPGMRPMLAIMDKRVRATKQTREDLGKIIAIWVEELRASLKLPEMLPVYEMGTEMHTHIDPIEEARAIVGDKRVITVDLGGAERKRGRA